MKQEVSLRLHGTESQEATLDMLHVVDTSKHVAGPETPRAALGLLFFLLDWIRIRIRIPRLE